MKLLITGGSGFIGSALARRMLKEGHTVTVFDNEVRGNISRLKDVIDDIKFIQGDIRDYASVLKATEGVDSIAHLAYINGTEFFYTKPELILEIALKGIVNTVDAAIANGVQNYFLMSSSEVYQTPDIVPTDENAIMKIPDPFNPRYSYGGGKLISELYLINYSRKYFERSLIIRPHNIYGPDMGWEHVIPQFAVRAINGLNSCFDSLIMPFKIQGNGTQTRSFCFIDDFVDGCNLLINYGSHNNIYNIGTTEEISMSLLANKVVGYFSKKPNIIHDIEPEGQTNRRCPDISKIISIGFRVQTTLDEGLKKTLPWYLNNIKHFPDYNI